MPATFSSEVANLILHLVFAVFYFSTADAMTDNKSFLVAEIGNFNARLSGWYVNDRSNFQGTKSDCLAAAYDLKLVIIKPTHFLDNFLLPALT